MLENANKLSRVIWNSMESEEVKSFHNVYDLSLIFPYSSESEIIEFINYSKKSEKYLPADLFESTYMSQRTLAGLKSHTDLLSYTRKPINSGLIILFLQNRCTNFYKRSTRFHRLFINKSM